MSVALNHVGDLSQCGSAALANVTPGITKERDQKSGCLSSLFLYVTSLSFPFFPHFLASNNE